jgi:hypothetical protein
MATRDPHRPYPCGRTRCILLPQARTRFAVSSKLRLNTFVKGNAAASAFPRYGGRLELVAHLHTHARVTR